MACRSCLIRETEKLRIEHLFNLKANGKRGLLTPLLSETKLAYTVSFSEPKLAYTASLGNEACPYIVTLGNEACLHRYFGNLANPINRETKD